MRDKARVSPFDKDELSCQVEALQYTEALHCNKHLHRTGLSKCEHVTGASFSRQSVAHQVGLLPLPLPALSVMPQAQHACTACARMPPGLPTFVCAMPSGFPVQSRQCRFLPWLHHRWKQRHLVLAGWLLPEGTNTLDIPTVSNCQPQQ